MGEVRGRQARKLLATPFWPTETPANLQRTRSRKRSMGSCHLLTEKIQLFTRHVTNPVVSHEFVSVLLTSNALIVKFTHLTCMLVFSIFTDMSNYPQNWFQNTGIAPPPQLWKSPHCCLSLWTFPRNAIIQCVASWVCFLSVRLMFARFPHVPARLRIPSCC